MRVTRVVAMTVGMAVGLSALTWYVITGSFGGVGESIAAGLLYLLPILALQAVLERPMRRWMAPARPPMYWVIFVAFKLTIALAGARLFVVRDSLVKDASQVGVRIPIGGIERQRLLKMRNRFGEPALLGQGNPQADRKSVV